MPPRTGLPIFPRGAGTGLAGESLGRGIVIDFSRYMRGIVSVDEESVRIQPGVVHARLNTLLRGRGRQFGPDPSMSNVTTMGSVIAIDAGGSHWLKYGSARRHVQRLQLVLADGAVMEVGREPLTAGQSGSPNAQGAVAGPAGGAGAARTKDDSPASAATAWSIASAIN